MQAVVVGVVVVTGVVVVVVAGVVVVVVAGVVVVVNGVVVVTFQLGGDGVGSEKWKNMNQWFSTQLTLELLDMCTNLSLKMFH